MRSIQALSLGFILGLCAALFGACGGGRTCDPRSCAGCCTDDGRCAAGTLQHECGATGAVCVTCSAQELCQAGVCMVFVGGGGGGGGGGGKTDGGADGGLVDGGADADGGTDAGWSPAYIGAACGTTEDCGGAPGSCLTEPIGFPGGYCTAFCTTDPALCGAGAVCFQFSSTGYCLDRCPIFAGEGCRTDYKCTRPPDLDGGFAADLVCLPKCSTSCIEGFTCNAATGFCCDAQNNCY